MNKCKTLLTAVLFVTLTLMTGCSSSDEDSTSDAVHNKVVSSQTLAPESDTAGKVTASTSVLSDATTLEITGDDLTKSKGTEQDVIVSLVPTPEQENVPKNTKIEVTFSVPLDVSAIQEHNVKLTYLSSKTNDHITGTISYSETEKKLTFTPNDLLEPGLYEVEIKSLKAEKAYKDVKINEIKYRFVVVKELLKRIVITPKIIDMLEGTSLRLGAIGYYDNDTEKNITTQAEWNVADIQMATIDSNATLKAVKEGTTTLTVRMEDVEESIKVVVYSEINGYRLPPEPDPTINNSTLLGIDSNSNGVRDDVERYVIIRFSKEEFPKTRTALAMQYAWAKQKIIETPTRESAKYSHDAIDCQYYWFHQKQQAQQQHMYELHKTNRMEAIKMSAEMGRWRLKYKVFNEDGINNVIFNTRERTKQDFAFNSAMSGGMYPGRDKSIDNCQVNIDLFGE